MTKKVYGYYFNIRVEDMLDEGEPDKEVSNTLYGVYEDLADAMTAVSDYMRKFQPVRKFESSSAFGKVFVAFAYDHKNRRCYVIEIDRTWITKSP